MRHEHETNHNLISKGHHKRTWDLVLGIHFELHGQPDQRRIGCRQPKISLQRLAEESGDLPSAGRQRADSAHHALLLEQQGGDGVDRLALSLKFAFKARRSAELHQSGRQTGAYNDRDPQW